MLRALRRQINGAFYLSWRAWTGKPCLAYIQRMTLIDAPAARAQLKDLAASRYHASCEASDPWHWHVHQGPYARRCGPARPNFCGQRQL